jgi:16S rRNA (guanine(966)-N(2))-methyltransferase RsmD
MRVIGGDHKGFRFHPPHQIPARPTTDFAKEALFNILNNHFYFDQVSFLDLFAGTGSISYEIFSRGCRDITMVDRSPVMMRFIQQTAERLNMEAEIIQDDVLRFIGQAWRSYDLIFAGPPYPMKEIDDIPDMIFESALLSKEGWFILETSPRHDFNDHQNLFKLKQYGQTHFWIFKNLVAP